MDFYTMAFIGLGVSFSIVVLIASLIQKENEKLKEENKILKKLLKDSINLKKTFALKDKNEN